MYVMMTMVSPWFQLLRSETRRSKKQNLKAARIVVSNVPVELNKESFQDTTLINRHVMGSWSIKGADTDVDNGRLTARRILPYSSKVREDERSPPIRQLVRSMIFP
jgi:hypothetical protein